MGTQLKMSTSFHPATDGQTKRTIQTLEDMPRAGVMKFGGSWEERVDAIVLEPEMIQEMVEQVHIIRQKMHAAQDRQKSYAYLKRSEIEFAVGDKVLLKVSPMKGLRKYMSDPTHVLEPEHVEIDKQLSYVEVEEVIWEAEAVMRDKNPSLFV
ncbi:uncharacterized protein LOC141628878 [Silene latifolia]|uniref:uncharacterized protein LOC141628878 n=1 Tax=Silene latifolia TaxID=37657 RepID=UPI003D77225C